VGGLLCKLIPLSKVYVHQ